MVIIIKNKNNVLYESPLNSVSYLLLAVRDNGHAELILQLSHFIGRADGTRRAVGAVAPLAPFFDSEAKPVPSNDIFY